MVKLPERGSRTANAIYAAYESNATDWRRDHLGASQIGKECSRMLWYGFRWAAATSFEGRMLRLFKRGDIEEDWIVEDLKAIGVAIDANDPETGEQWVFRLTQHFGGSGDGLITGGVPEAPKALHLFECKTANAKSFARMKKNGVEAEKPEHFAQMQTYMLGFHERGLKVKRALYVMVNKDTDEIYTERIAYDPAVGKAMVARSEMVVNSPEPLTKISEDPTMRPCVWCDMRNICHLEKVEDLERNCRTCASSTPKKDGTWHCDLYDVTIDSEKQRLGCTDHVFIPALLPWEQVDADEEQREVFYEDRNGVRFRDANRELTVMEE